MKCNEASMEERKSNLIAILSVVLLMSFLVAARLSLGLSNSFYLITGADAAAILAVIAWAIIRRCADGRRRLREAQIASDCRELRVEYSFLRRVAGLPTKFRYGELEEATESFKTLLGRGASASVFKGILRDGTPVAVKRIGVGGHDEESQGCRRGEREYRSEVAAIAGVQHVNLVRLLGYCCPPGRPRFLVYEFIPNGSLDCWIFPKTLARSPNPSGGGGGSAGGGCLPWNLRYGAAVDVARGLSYLHSDCRSRILHLDVKPENILLDESFRAMVADFGLSKLMRRDESRVVTTVRGTRGYLAPEWLLQNGISEKSDVYSYGMVLLELIGGRRNVSLIDGGGEQKEGRKGRKWEYFPKIVSDRVKEGKLMEVVDRRLLCGGGGVVEEEVRRLVYVALWCVQEEARLRPSMGKVVEMLEGRAAVEEPPETEMIIVDLLAIGEDTTAGGVRSGIGAVTKGKAEGGGLPSTSICSCAMSAVSAR